jgi:hypothetical protein
MPHEDGWAEKELAAPNRRAQYDDAGPDDAHPAEPHRGGRHRQIRPHPRIEPRLGFNAIAVLWPTGATEIRFLVYAASRALISSSMNCESTGLTPAPAM